MKMLSKKPYDLVSEDGYDTRIPLHNDEAFQHGIHFQAKVTDTIFNTSTSVSSGYFYVQGALFTVPVIFPITANIVSSNPAHGEVYLKQHYMIKFVNELWQVDGFLQFSPPITLTATI
jgi:hypothetical protein